VDRRSEHRARYCWRAMASRGGSSNRGVSGAYRLASSQVRPLI
jgi:hypothetical protein